MNQTAPGGTWTCSTGASTSSRVRRDLRLDRRHKRFYFAPLEIAQERWVEFRPLNQERTGRRVVWQPKRKATGEPKPYWYDRAVALRFHRVGPRSWCLSIRPEMHVTTDSDRPPRPELVGRRVTRKFARMFNNGPLAEVSF